MPSLQQVLLPSLRCGGAAPAPPGLQQARFSAAGTRSAAWQLLAAAQRTSLPPASQSNPLPVLQKQRLLSVRHMHQRHSYGRLVVIAATSGRGQRKRIWTAQLWRRRETTPALCGHQKCQKPVPWPSPRGILAMISCGPSTSQAAGRCSRPLIKAPLRRWRQRLRLTEMPGRLASAARRTPSQAKCAGCCPQPVWLPNCC